MDPKELRGLVEAYNQVYELDENRMASRMEKMPSAPAKVGKATHSIKDLAPSKPPTPEEKAKARKALGLGEAVKGESSERRKDLAAQRRAGDKPLSPAKGRDNANKMQRDINYFDKLTKKNKNVVGLVSNEEVDLFDTVLEFLCAEGYAETLEEAEWIMANELDAEDIEEILEAEGSYGQTPKARTAMSKLTIDRMHKPASEYSQRGEKTKKVKAAEKQTRRQDVLSRGLSGGKKSSRPSSARGKMDADERSERRAERAFDLETTYGSGSVTKNPKKLRKQKAMGEHD
jgi:hypothetical protein